MYVSVVSQGRPSSIKRFFFIYCTAVCYRLVFNFSATSNEKYLFLVFVYFIQWYSFLKWMFRSDQDVCKNSRSRLDLAYLTLNKFITSRISQKIEKKDQNSTLFLMTENGCWDRIELSQEFDLGKNSIVILEYLELVFCYILGINRKI